MPTLAELWDWRRQVTELYGGIRRNPDPEAAWNTWRSTRDTLFAQHPQTPIEPPDRAAFRALPLFPYDPALRFTVALRPIEGAAAETFPAGADGTLSMLPFARTIGLNTPLGGELTLYWITGYGGGVFLPFRDATSGRGSYGGGRYLLDTIKGADLGQTSAGAAVLDFNFAYNPSCAYSPRYVCPLSPPGNRLAQPVRAGEAAPDLASVRAMHGKETMW